MIKTLYVLAIAIFLIASPLPCIVSRDCELINDISQCSTTVFLFGFFPSITDSNITYMTLIPLRWETISADWFKGYTGKFIIIGIYEIVVEPIAEFIYEPLEDKLRVKENPIFFTSISNDPDGIIVEEWWQFEESEPWIMIENPSYVYNESGYYNVSLRVIDDDGLNDTYMKRIKVYERLPKFQCKIDLISRTLTIVGYKVIGSNANYDWDDFENIGSGNCTLPSDGHLNIGDNITDCFGEIKLQYVPNGVIAGEWQFS